MSSDQQLRDAAKGKLFVDLYKVAHAGVHGRYSEYYAEMNLQKAEGILKEAEGPFRTALEDRRKVERRNRANRMCLSPERRIKDRRKGKEENGDSSERKALERLLSTLCVGAFAVPIEEVARRIHALYRPAPDAAMVERLKEIRSDYGSAINEGFL